MKNALNGAALAVCLSCLIHQGGIWGLVFGLAVAANGFFLGLTLNLRETPNE